MSDVFELCDELGPAKVIHVHEPDIGLKGILVVDNVAAGPSIGGLRMAPDVSLSECHRLARAMTHKCALADLQVGGAKIVVMDREDLDLEPAYRALYLGLACGLVRTKVSPSQMPFRELFSA